MADAVCGILRAMIVEWVPFSRGIFPTQGSNPGRLALQADSLPCEPPGKPAAEARAPLLSPSRPGVLSWLREGSGPLGVGREFQTTEGLLRGKGCSWGLVDPRETFPEERDSYVVPMGCTAVVHQEAGYSQGY